MEMLPPTLCQPCPLASLSNFLALTPFIDNPARLPQSWRTHGLATSVDTEQMTHSVYSIWRHICGQSFFLLANLKVTVVVGESSTRSEQSFRISLS